jgi:ectoine hydroxylase-related dioxygenase (phytanoyl-CoA dioxygenase family)
MTETKHCTEASIRERVQQYGYAIVSDVLPRETVNDLSAEIEFALRRDGTAARGDHAMRHLLRSVPAVRTVAESAAVRGLVEPVLGPNCFIVRSIFFDKTEGANWKVPWHQDLTITVAERVEVAGFTAWSVKDEVVHVRPPSAILERMLTARLHLDDCEPAPVSTVTRCAAARCWISFSGVVMRR